MLRPKKEGAFFMEKKFDAYEMATDRIISLLESGLIPWARPWGAVTACAWSRSTGKP